MRRVFGSNDGGYTKPFLIPLCVTSISVAVFTSSRPDTRPLQWVNPRRTKIRIHQQHTATATADQRVQALSQIPTLFALERVWRSKVCNSIPSNSCYRSQARRSIHSGIRINSEISLNSSSAPQWCPCRSLDIQNLPFLGHTECPVSGRAHNCFVRLLSLAALHLLQDNPVQ